MAAAGTTVAPRTAAAASILKWFTVLSSTGLQVLLVRNVNADYVGPLGNLDN
jgi:hypothetical protein